MSRPLELPDPIYDALSQAAAASGTTPAGWIASHLPPAQPGTSNGVKTLADLFLGRTGHISSGGQAVLSENCGERFADDMQRKRSEGRL